jgi:hypothetical protein
MLLLAEDVLDLAVRLGVVGAVLHQVEPIGAHVEGLEHLVVFAPAMKVSVRVGHADDRHLGADRHVDALRLAVPDIDAAIAELGEGRPRPDIDRAGGRHDAGLVAGHLILERLALLELDDVEVVQRHTALSASTIGLFWLS